MTAALKVLLLLLKWLGILLLVVLGLVLLLVLLVLLAPIRYKGKLAKKEAPEEIFSADALVSWLNPLLRIRILFREKKLRYTVRIFGFCLMDSEKPKKEKKKKDKPKKAKKKKSEKQSKESRKKKKAGQSQTPEQTVESSHAEELSETAETVSGESFEAEQVVSETEMSLNSEPGEETTSTPETDGDEKKKRSLFAKIKAIIEKIKAIPETIKQKVTHFWNTLKLLWYKKEKAVAFFEDELHILALGKSWKAVKQLLCHILPGKVKGHVEFGTGDPESTGKALGALGVLYAAYGKGLTIVPDFNEKRLVAELSLKGRIRCGTVLVICLKLIRDKQVKRLYQNWKKLLKLLKQKAE